MANNNSNILVDEKLAISMFLDSLLREPEHETELALPTPAPVAEEKVNIATATVEPVVESKLEVKVDDEVITKNEIKVQVVAEVLTPVEEHKDAAESAVPEWANKPFQVLLFDVAGLKLAVPLIELCGVIEWKDSVTEMPGHADFYMGILQHLNHKIAVIDTAKMVIPADKQAKLVGDNPRERVKHIVLIGDYSWGLACDKIGEVITLQPGEVRWRTSKTSRSWLAGTVIEHMCALLNSEGFASMLRKK